MANLDGISTRPRNSAVKIHLKHLKRTHNDGKRLENAVKLIQELMLRSDPSVAGEEFPIEQNKLFEINGTKHEVDVYVVT